MTEQEYRQYINENYSPEEAHLYEAMYNEGAVWNGIKKFVKGAWNTIGQSINDAADGLNNNLTRRPTSNTTSSTTSSNTNTSSPSQATYQDTTQIDTAISMISKDIVNAVTEMNKQSGKMYNAFGKTNSTVGRSQFNYNNINTQIGNNYRLGQTQVKNKEKTDNLKAGKGALKAGRKDGINDQTAKIKAKQKVQASLNLNNIYGQIYREAESFGPKIKQDKLASKLEEYGLNTTDQKTIIEFLKGLWNKDRDDFKNLVQMLYKNYPNRKQGKVFQSIAAQETAEKNFKARQSKLAPEAATNGEEVPETAPVQEEKPVQQTQPVQEEKPESPSQQQQP